MPCYELDSAPEGYVGSEYSTLQECISDCGACGYTSVLNCEFFSLADAPAYYAWSGPSCSPGNCEIQLEDAQGCHPVGTTPGPIGNTWIGTVTGWIAVGEDAGTQLSYTCDASNYGVVADFSIPCQCI